MQINVKLLMRGQEYASLSCFNIRHSIFPVTGIRNHSFWHYNLSYNKIHPVAEGEGELSKAQIRANYSGFNMECALCYTILKFNMLRRMGKK